MLVGLVFFSQLVSSSAFLAKVPLPMHFTSSPRWYPLNAENGVSMDGLSLHQEDALWIGETVQSWLDQEYIALPVHRKIGEVVQRVYLEQRREGVNDLGEMLMKMGSSLETFDLEDAFVGPWDIANKVHRPSNSSFINRTMFPRYLTSCCSEWIASYVPAPMSRPGRW